MPLGSTNRPKPGLKAIYEGREARQPGGKYGRPSTGLYLFGVSAILGSLVVYHYVSADLLTLRLPFVTCQRCRL